MWLPAAFVAVSETVYVPAAVYVCDGFSSIEVLPSPNVHDHVVGEFVEASRNVTVKGIVPVVDEAEKAATGSDSVADTGNTIRARTKTMQNPKPIILG